MWWQHPIEFAVGLLVLVALYYFDRWMHPTWPPRKKR